MMKNSLLLAGLSLLASASTLLGQSSPDDIKGYAPVSVSSANYSETSRDVLLQMANQKSSINPSDREMKPLAQPRHFIFVPGEIYESDLTYEQVCELLTTALAKKNYINGADAQGIIREPTKITTVLRVNFGQRLWRVPSVRTEHLTWRDGVQQKVHDSRSLTNLGGDVTWDSRAGGNDDALSAGASNAANGNSFGWGPTNPGSSGTSLTENLVAPSGSLSSYEGTRNFNLVVVDAFDYAELKAKGKSAKRLWTTFVAAPVTQRGEKFSDILDTLLRAAGPYWGETSSGMQVYTDARAKVEIGEAVEVNDSSEALKK